MNLVAAFGSWLIGSKIGRIVLALGLALAVLKGYGWNEARKARAEYVAAQRVATAKESDRRIAVFTRLHDVADVTLRSLQERQRVLDQGVSHAELVSRRAPDLSCLDLGSVRALDAVRRAPRL